MASERPQPAPPRAPPRAPELLAPNRLGLAAPPLLEQPAPNRSLPPL